MSNTTPTPVSCGSPLRPSRRTLLRGAAALAATASPVSAARAQAQDRTIVLVNLRGGLDGLAACTPLFEGGQLASLRPSLLVPTAVSAGAVPIGTGYALHPAFAPLSGAVQSGELAVVHACGFEDPTRSHFAARERIGAGLPGGVGLPDTGWVGRALLAAPERDPVAPRAVAIGPGLPRAFRGAPRAVAVNEPGNFATFGIGSTSAARRATLRQMAVGAAGAPSGALTSDLAKSASDSLSAFDTIGALDFTRSPAAGAAYPGTKLGERLFDAATIIRSNIGTEVIYVDSARDWDDHDDMGPVSGSLAARLDELARSLAAFRTDLGATDFARVTVVVTSEFGRRVDQNGSAGTDHGRGGVAFVLGGGLSGGEVFGSWPGLEAGSLDMGALAVTTDLRSVFTEVFAAGLGAASLEGTFPGFTPTRLGLY